jgi:hypothetical protein
LSPVELLQVVSIVVQLRECGVSPLDWVSAMVPSRLGCLQVIEALAGLLDRRRFVAEELGRAVEVAELDEAFDAPAAGEDR